MTVKEAIKNIDDVLSADIHYDESIDYLVTSDDIEWLEMAKEALERAEKKKPTFVMRNFSEELCCSILHGHCPSCKKISLNWSAFCSNCGQALDWSDVE